MAGIYLGLDRPSIESSLRLMAVKAEQHSKVFDDLLVMESAALTILNERQD